MSPGTIVQKVLLLQCFALLAVTCCSGKDPAYIDSLKHLVKTSTDTKTKIDALNAYAYEYRNGNIDSGIIIAELAYELSEKINYHTGIGDYYDCIGSFLFNDKPDTAIALFYQAIAEYNRDKDYHKVMNEEASLGNAFLVADQYDSALYHVRKALYYIEHSKEMDAKTRDNNRMWQYQTIGTIYYYQSYYDSSIIYSQKGIEIAERLKNKNAESALVVTIANVYAQQDDYKKAIEYEKRALAIDIGLKYYRGCILERTNIASYYIFLKDIKKAKSYADSAVKEGLHYKIEKYMPHNYQTFGDIAREEHSYNEALQYYRESLAYCVKFPNTFIESGTLRDMGDTYLYLGKPGKAKDNFLLSLKKCEDDRESKQLCYDGLADAYEKLGNHKEALHYLKLSLALKDSIFNDNTKETINSLDIKYETKKKEQQIQLLSKDNELKDARNQKEEQQKYFAYSAFVILLSFGTYSFYRFRRQKKTEHERAILKERLRISRDLHDDMGATLSSISVYSTAIKQQLKDGRIADAQHMLDTISEDARDMVTNMSDLVWMINPQNVTVGKLFDRMQLFASNVISAKNIFFHCSIDEDLEGQVLNIDARKNIYLISKEAFNNAVKYADCDNIKIDVQRRDNDLVLKIEDDGKGFDINAKNDGNGLENMKQRAEELNGTFSMDSEPGKARDSVFYFISPKLGAHNIMIGSTFVI